MNAMHFLRYMLKNKRVNMQIIILRRIVYKWVLSFSFLMHVDGMQSGNITKIPIDIKRPLVIRALRRSNIRKKIAEYLFDISPSCSYTSEIAYHVKTTPTNVIGAMRGMGTRYKEDESLINLDIVEEKSCNKNIRLYGLTSFGKEVIETIHKRE